jgi:hypothetical protein
MSLVLIPVLLAGCLEIETTTTVNRDGSLQRSLTIQGDSTSIYSGHYTVPIDATWSQEIRKIEEKKYKLTAVKDFADVEEINKELAGVRGKTLEATVSIEEGFQWFTTTITYRETVRRFNSVDELPITDFISQSEIDRAIEHEILKHPYETAGDSLSLDDASDRFEEWMERNIFAAYFRIFLEGVRELNDETLTVNYVKSLEDSLFTVFSKIDEKRSHVQRKAFEDILKLPAVDEVYQLQEEEFRQLHEALEFVDEVSKNTYRSSVIMPGLILNTNASSLEGNRAIWRDYMAIVYFQDFELWITSQVINWWAVVVTASVVLGGLVVLVLAAVRRKKNGAS